MFVFLFVLLLFCFDLIWFVGFCVCVCVCFCRGGMGVYFLWFFIRPNLLYLFRACLAICRTINRSDPWFIQKSIVTMDTIWEATSLDQSYIVYKTFFSGKWFLFRLCPGTSHPQIFCRRMELKDSTSCYENTSTWENKKFSRTVPVSETTNLMPLLKQENWQIKIINVLYIQYIFNSYIFNKNINNFILLNKIINEVLNMQWTGLVEFKQERIRLGHHSSCPRVNISNRLKTAVSIPGNMQLSSLTTESPRWVLQMQMSILDLFKVR